jgi:hypothetical protein
MSHCPCTPRTSGVSTRALSTTEIAVLVGAPVLGFLVAPRHRLLGALAGGAAGALTAFYLHTRPQTPNAPVAP